jgi:hypothetical protein
MRKAVFSIFTSLILLLLSGQRLCAHDVTGSVLYKGDATRPISNASVCLLEGTTNNVLFCTTGSNGVYTFSGVPDGSYTLSATTSIQSGGVTMYDACLVFLNIFGFYQFTPMQFMASDVDGNQAINWTDFNLIISHVFSNAPFPVGPWRFETLTFTLSGLKDGVPHGIGGTCSGDVGGTFVPTVNTTPAMPVTQSGEVETSAGEPFTTRISVTNDMSISSAGIMVNFPNNLLTIESVDFKGEGFTYNIIDGQLRILWGDPDTKPIHFTAGETLLTIHGTSSSSFEKGMSASLTLDGNTSLINPETKEITNQKFTTPLIRSGVLRLTLNNFPNPFGDQTTFSLLAPASGKASLEIYSASGRNVRTLDLGMVNKGTREIRFDASDLETGTYIGRVTLQTETETLTTSIRLLKAN